MSNLLGTPTSSNPLWVAMETMHLHIAQIGYILSTALFRIKGVLINIFFTHEKLSLRVHGKLN